MDSLTFSLALPACFWTSLAMPSAVAILTAADESFYTRSNLRTTALDAARQFRDVGRSCLTPSGPLSHEHTCLPLLGRRTIVAVAPDVRHAARLFVD